MSDKGGKEEGGGPGEENARGDEACAQCRISVKGLCARLG